MRFWLEEVNGAARQGWALTEQLPSTAEGDQQSNTSLVSGVGAVTHPRQGVAL